MLFLAVVIYLHQRRILRGGVERCAPPLRIFAPLRKGHAPPFGKISMMEQSENVMVASDLHFVT
jgi:hypothetical protein